MISSFHIQNFRSVLDVRLDFSFGEGKAPNGWHEQEQLPFIEAGNKERLVPCMAFFGANAAGKTNLLKAAAALYNLVVPGGLTLPQLFEPNLLNRKFSATTFALQFFFDGDRFDYTIVYNASEIVEEKLEKDTKLIYAIHRLKADFSQKIVSSTYSREKLSDILKVECSDGESRQNKPFLHRIGRGYSGLNDDLRSVFNFFANHFKYVMGPGNVPLPVVVEILASTLDGDQNKALREITNVVRKLDIDISTIDIIQKEISSNEQSPTGITKTDHKTGAIHSLWITTTHEASDGKPAILDFIKHESDGTQRLAGLIGLVLYSLETGSVLFVDELECSLHPLLMREIVLLFKKKRHNHKGAQLIVTTHNMDILDDSILRLSEIALVRKTTANGTLVRRLVDAKKEGQEIRTVTNFRKQYLAGFYSGVPHPAL